MRAHLLAPPPAPRACPAPLPSPVPLAFRAARSAPRTPPRAAEPFELPRPAPPLKPPRPCPPLAARSRQVRALPPLRPLVLAAKALLKEAGLNEVFTGGLSSYSLLNMAVAHLQCEGLSPDPRAASSAEGALVGDDAQAAFLQGLASQVGAKTSRGGGRAHAGGPSRARPWFPAAAGLLLQARP
jgi:hypothetical protein